MSEIEKNNSSNSNKKKSSFLEDLINLGPYLVDCVDGIAHRFLKQDMIIIGFILIFFMWVRYELYLNFAVMEIGIDAAFFIYNCIAELWNLLMPFFSTISHVMEDIKKFLGIDSGILKLINEMVQAIEHIKFYIFNISDVNRVFSGIGNSRNFVTATEFKNIISWLFGDRLCYAARALDKTYLSPLCYVLSLGFHGGYKPDPTSANENCMIQTTSPNLDETWLTVLLFSIQLVETFLLIYILITFWHVIRKPKKYIP